MLEFNCKESGLRDELRAAERIDPARFHTRRLKELEIKPAELAVSGPLAPGKPGVGSYFTISTDVVSGKPLSRVWMVLLPTTQSWHAPALLMFGAFNDCPLACQPCHTAPWLAAAIRLRDRRHQH